MLLKPSIEPLLEYLRRGKMYRCGNCNKNLNLKREDPIRCPFCGHKLLFKTRPTIIKKVKAE
jgi:DNA-directed RNA polymerase subunit RPC12/RpoP